MIGFLQSEVHCELGKMRYGRIQALFVFNNGSCTVERVSLALKRELGERETLAGG